jgi:hypothetical protein
MADEISQLPHAEPLDEEQLNHVAGGAGLASQPSWMSAAAITNIRTNSNAGTTANQAKLMQGASYRILPDGRIVMGK